MEVVGEDVLLSTNEGEDDLSQVSFHQLPVIFLGPWPRIPNADLDPEVLKWREKQSLINKSFFFAGNNIFLLLKDVLK